MARGIQGVILKVFGARDFTATVLESVLIAPHVIRIRMRASTPFSEVEAQPAAWLRFWFPDPHGSRSEFQRAYTLSEVDAATGLFAIDVVLHEPAGPASTWARGVAPGAVVAVTSLMGSTRFAIPDRQPAGFLLVGDAAALPGINAIIRALPEDVAVELYLEIHQDDDTAIPITPHSGLRVHQVARLSESSLAEAIDERDWTHWYVWAAPEASTLKKVRTRLLRDFGVPKSAVHAQAYWNAGRQMGVHRDGGSLSAGRP